MSITTTSWSVYMVRCADGSLYTGISTDVERRVEEHNTSPKSAKYTRSRRPVVLVYTQICSTHIEALRTERSIKKLSRPQKEKIITTRP